jgi:RNA-binding protein
MEKALISSADKMRLRGLGQQLEATLKVGKEGLTPAFFTELDRQMRTHELVKLRFLGADRHQRANLCLEIAEKGRCACVGAVGHTALFYRPSSEQDTVVL